MPYTRKQVLAMAPILQLHPDEKYNPMEPVDFIKRSRFRHHKGGGRDQGYSKTKKKWRTTNSKNKEYYDIPIRTINAYKKAGNGENRRPRDSNNGDDWNVFLQPKGKPRGIKRPNKKVPAYYYSRSIDTSKVPASIRKMLKIKVVKFDLISYWWFMSYNDGPVVQNHQGDWEHVTLRLKNKKLIGVYFAAHGRNPRYVLSRNLRRRDGRFLVYCARGTHASYEKAGKFTLLNLGVIRFKDETKNGGYGWDISQNLQSLSSQPWRDYAGAWGEVGQLADTTGPLGPWLKRNKK